MRSMNGSAVPITPCAAEISFTSGLDMLPPEALALFAGLNLASTCYSYGWDLYMDWGLLRTK